LLQELEIENVVEKEASYPHYPQINDDKEKQRSLHKEVV